MSKTSEEMIDVIDEDENVIDIRPKSEVMEKKLLHFGVAVYVFNSKGEIYIHQRASDKQRYPLYWDMVVGGWVLSGEKVEDAVYREAEEELGVHGAEFKFLFKHRYKSDIDDSLLHQYFCIYDGEIKLQKEEIVQGRFVKIGELENLIKTEKFCPDSLEVWEKYKKII